MQPIEPISFTGKLSLQDCLDIHRYHSRIVLRPSVRVLMVLVSILIATIVISAGISSHFELISFVVLGFCAYCSFGWFLLGRRNVRRRYKHDVARFGETTVTFTEDTVSSSDSRISIRMPWSQMASIIITPRGLLFLVPPHQTWFWLPQRLFEGNSEKEAILELATQHEIPLRWMK